MKADCGGRSQTLIANPFEQRTGSGREPSVPKTRMTVEACPALGAHGSPARDWHLQVVAKVAPAV